MDESTHFFKRGVIWAILGWTLSLQLSYADLGDHILSRVEQKALNIRSYKTNFDLWMRIGEEEFSLVGTTLFKWPQMLRIEMMLQGQKELGQVLYQKEGIVWQYLPSAGIAFRRQESLLKKKFPKSFASQDLLNIQNPFEMVESESIQFLDEEQVGGETTYLFEGVPKKSIQHQGVMSPVFCRLRIAEKDGLLRDFMMYDASGVLLVKQHYWDIQANLEILDEEFVFQAEDVKLIEVTKRTEKMMELILEETPQ